MSGFDADGFLTRRGGDIFQYSATGELLKATLADGIVIEYTYDGIGRRMARTVNGQTWQYLYGNPGNPVQITATREPDGTLTGYYYDGDGRLFSFARNGVRYYAACDQVSTPKVVTDTAGNTVKQLSYDSFGCLTNDSNPTFFLPVGFAGGLADPDTGLVRCGFRDYDPEAGRWTAKDPIFFAGGQFNLYGYCGSDPVNWRDGLGLFVFGKRPLQGMPWIPGVSTNFIDDYFDTEFSHEHGFFEDGSGDNVGFGPEGRFSENPCGKGYRFEDKHYDDGLMRQALNNVVDGNYSALTNNCQDWCERLRIEYYKLKQE